MYEKRGKIMGRPKLAATKEAHVFSYKTKSNQKRYAYRYRHTRVDNTRKEFYKQGFIALKDATLALTELKAELLKGNYGQVDHRHLTLAQAFEMFIEYRKNDIKPNTLHATQSISKRMNPLIGDVPINKLTPYLYKKSFLNKLGNVKTSTLAKYHSRICTVLNFAVQNDFLDKNRLLSITFDYDVEHKVIEVEEMTQIIAYTRKNKPYMLHFLLFLINTGVRVGEALGVKWRDIDFVEGTVDINCTMTTDYGEGTPKTKNSYRLIPLPSKILTQLKKYKLQQKEGLLQGGLAAEFISGKQFELRYVFRNSRGMPLRYSAVKFFFRTMRKKLEIEKLSPHVFRHTYASVLISEGVDIATVASLMGDSVGTIQTTYIHAINDKREEAIQRIGKIFEKY